MPSTDYQRSSDKKYEKLRKKGKLVKQTEKASHRCSQTRTEAGKREADPARSNRAAWGREVPSSRFIDSGFLQNPGRVSGGVF
jgi:hypothetical protein